MITILLRIFLNAFSWMKIVVFLMKFRWKCSSIDSDNGLVPARQQAIFRIFDGLVYWCIYASPGLDELMIYSWWWVSCEGLLGTKLSVLCSICEIHTHSPTYTWTKLWIPALKLWCLKLEMQHFREFFVGHQRRTVEWPIKDHFLSMAEQGLSKWKLKLHV